MDEDKKIEAGEQEEKELTAKEKIEVLSTTFLFMLIFWTCISHTQLERQEEAKLKAKFPMVGRPGLPGKPAGGKWNGWSGLYWLNFCDVPR